MERGNKTKRENKVESRIGRKKVRGVVCPLNTSEVNFTIPVTNLRKPQKHQWKVNGGKDSVH